MSTFVEQNKESTTAQRSVPGQPQAADPSFEELPAEETPELLNEEQIPRVNTRGNMPSGRGSFGAPRGGFGGFRRGGFVGGARSAPPFDGLEPEFELPERFPDGRGVRGGHRGPRGGFAMRGGRGGLGGPQGRGGYQRPGDCPNDPRPGMLANDPRLDMFCNDPRLQMFGSDPRMNMMNSDPRMNMMDPRMNMMDARMNMMDPRMNMTDPRMNMMNSDPRTGFFDVSSRQHMFDGRFGPQCSRTATNGHESPSARESRQGPCGFTNDPRREHFGEDPRHQFPTWNFYFDSGAVDPSTAKA